MTRANSTRMHTVLIRHETLVDTAKDRLCSLQTELGRAIPASTLKPCTRFHSVVVLRDVAVRILSRLMRSAVPPKTSMLIVGPEATHS